MTPAEFEKLSLQEQTDIWPSLGKSEQEAIRGLRPRSPVLRQFVDPVRVEVRSQSQTASGEVAQSVVITDINVPFGSVLVLVFRVTLACILIGAFFGVIYAVIRALGDR